MIRLTLKEIFQNINRIKKNADQLKRTYISNIYFFFDPLKAEELYDARMAEDTIIFIKHDVGSIDRVFFATSNLDRLSDMLSDVCIQSVIDYNSESETCDISEALKKAGYSHYSTYIRRHYDVVSNNYEFNNNEKALLDRFYSENYVSYATEHESNLIYSILWEVFDPKRDHLPDIETLNRWIQEKRVLYYEENGEIYSIYIYEVYGKKMYSAFSYNKTSADKLYSLEKKAFYDAIERYGITQKYSWVNVKNYRAADRTNYVNEELYNYIFCKDDSDVKEKKDDWVINIENLSEHLDGRKVVIWGVTIISTLVCEWAKENGIDVECFVDQEYNDYNDNVCGLNVNRIDDYLGKTADYYFWIFTPYRSDIEKKLDNLEMVDMKDYLYIARCTRFNEEHHSSVLPIYFDYAKNTPLLSGIEPYHDNNNNIINGSSYKNVKLVGANCRIDLGENVHISQKSRLILKDNSSVSIGNNVEIHGVIVVADNSHLEIGDNCTLNKSEIMCIKNSYIYISDDCKFKKSYVNALDTSKLHIRERCYCGKKTKIYSQIHSEVSVGARLVLYPKAYIVGRKWSTVNLGSSVTLKEQSGLSSQKRCTLNLGDDSKIGEKTSISALYKSTVEIGDHFSTQILTLILAKYNSSIKIGRCVWTRWNLFMNAGYFSTINVGDRTQFARNDLVVCGNSHPIFEAGQSEGEYRSDSVIDIGKNVWIGNDACINSGTSLGDNCIVAVQSTVNRKIPENCMVMGNPARIIRKNVYKGIADDPSLELSKQTKEVWENERENTEKSEKDKA